MADPLLSVEGLCVERGGRPVLDSLSLTLNAGEAILVSGRNGAGKSTLLRTLAGLLPATSGDIRFKLASEEVRGVETVHYLGYEDALKPSLTVGENLAFWAAMLRSPHGEEPATPASRTTRVPEGESAGPPSWFETAAAQPLTMRANGSSRYLRAALSPTDALAAFGIARLIDLPAAYLSAGQKRRVALARLLLAARPIWLLDEPLIALDTGAQQRLTGLMADHLARGGAILVASHQPLALIYRELDLAPRA